jgi:hypothetical protein
MRERDVNRKMFHRGHYEVIAGRFREQLRPIQEAEEYFQQQYGDEGNWPGRTGQLDKARLQRNAIVDLALSFAGRFALDNDEFDPIIFLDKCSPDTERMPISELWEGYLDGQSKLHAESEERGSNV